MKNNDSSDADSVQGFGFVLGVLALLALPVVLIGAIVAVIAAILG